MLFYIDSQSKLNIRNRLEEKPDERKITGTCISAHGTAIKEIKGNFHDGGTQVFFNESSQEQRNSHK